MPSQPFVVPAQLPAMSGLPFVGREAELGRLDAALSRDGDAPVVVIAGAGGVGKTSLALHWAHRNAGLFPDGHLHVHLHGFDPVTPPVPPEEAVRGFLLALGADPRTIPSAPDAQAALYRSMMAGRRMLVLIDDAASAEQLEPLLPGTPSSAVLVTSRRPLSGPAAGQPVPLEGLDEREASRLLVRTVGATRPHAVRDLARHCAGLPLTLSLVAARVAARPHLPLDALTSELRAATTSLNTTDTGEVTPSPRGEVAHALSGDSLPGSPHEVASDPGREITPSLHAASDPGSEITPSLHAAFDASYLTLAEDAKRLFQALGPAPVPDVGLSAAASLAAVPAARTRTLMRVLEAAHLVTQHRPGRYRMHDLVRLYAIEQAEPASSATAQSRLIDHYLHTAHRGGLTLAPQLQPIPLNPPAPGVDLAPLTTEQDALEWFDAEHDCLLSLLRWTADQDRNEDAWRIAWSMDEMLRRRGHVHERVQVWQAAVFAAERLGAADVQCLAYRRLSQAHVQAGDPAAALPALHRALALDEHLQGRRRPAATVRRHLVR
uniref:Transcriptional regulator, SARP family n=2 Tax=Nonomuraea gerenzanensis TaxID=93944 RepID=A0A1M4ED87_9ACTN|nr:NB-ARC domain-containing protein [Nonomuraea gerenzanensis]SBO96951.1 transcriptional regulator, SARP family [Nonomuraea gerenzanensis]